MRKLPVVARQVEKLGFATLIEAEPVTREQLETIHHRRYVKSILTGRGELADCAFGYWSESYRDGVLAINGGNLLAAKMALEHGIAANIGQGFHHARPKTGAGFCTFNGLALVAALNAELTVLVIDCDEHAGDGTAEFARTLPNLSNFSICGTHLNCPEHERSVVRFVPPGDVAAYRAYVAEAIVYAENLQPDLVIYQAGMDSHEADPVGRAKMPGDFLRERDLTIMNALARQLRIPFFFVLAGGYQEPMEDTLVPLHVSTFEIAAQLFRQDLMPEIEIGRLLAGLSTTPASSAAA